MNRGYQPAVLTTITFACVLIAFAVGCSADEAVVTEQAVVIELRVWQPVDAADEELWVSARPQGGEWDALGTIPFPLDGVAGGISTVSRYRFGDFPIAGVALRVWQSAAEPANIYVQACVTTCPERALGEWPWPWRPLGMVPLPLDDGHSTVYRYGDITVVVPRDNPGLIEDREYLLALRDVLEGNSAELDWSVGRATADWEGVTLGGVPLRVTGLELSERGLTGEVWGYLGDLTELTELRLDGNELTGGIPSKLVLLKKLTHISLAGNALAGCIPPPLQEVPDNDLDSLGLPDCSQPQPVFDRDPQTFVAGPGTYRFRLNRTFHLPIYEGWRPLHLVLDVPAGASIRFVFFEPALGVIESQRSSPENILERDIPGLAVRDIRDRDTWLFLEEPTGDELERSPYAGCVYGCGVDGSGAALVEQLAASVWVNTAIDDDALTCTAIDGATAKCSWRWVWP